MGKVHCPGGHTFSDNGFPCPCEYFLISEPAVEKLAADIMQDVEVGEDVDLRIQVLISEAGPTAYKCPECGRLLVFWQGTDKTAQSFIPEEAKLSIQ